MLSRDKGFGGLVLRIYCVKIQQEVLVASLLCRFKPEIEIQNPAGSLGGFAVVLVQAINCNC